MKKVLLFTGLFILLGTISSFAQLQEVRGVETRWAIFRGAPYSVPIRASHWQPAHNASVNTYFGPAFSNRNSFAVSIEAELWQVINEVVERSNRFGVPDITQRREILIDTRSFNLNAGEEFIWRHETRGNFRQYRTCTGSHTGFERLEHARRNRVDGDYFVRFRAFRLD